MEDKILLYSELSPEERRDLEEHVREHPEMAPRLEEAGAFGALLQQAQMLCADPPGDEALAYYIATRAVSRHPLPASLGEAFARIESRLTADAPLRTRYEELVGRMGTLEAASDPVEQFERLTGRRIVQAAQPAVGALPETEVIARSASVAPPVIHRLWWRSGQWAAAAVVFLLALYGALALVSRASQSDLDRLAMLDDSAIEAEGLRMRGGVTQPDYASSEEHYRRAVELLRMARSHTLGLFPRYDQERLRRAAGFLEGVIARDPEDSRLRSEAHYLLAKIHLARKDVAGARAALEAVVAGAGWKAPEARALLEKIEAQRL